MQAMDLAFQVLKEDLPDLFGYDMKQPDDIRLAVVGSRHYGNPQTYGHESAEAMYQTFAQKLDEWSDENGTPNQIISGGAPGADTMSERWAEERDIPHKVHPAEWHKYGRRAGPLRNQFIHDDATHGVAFMHEGSKGTKHTVSLFHRSGKPMTVHVIEE
jgi:hypothetical protein